jgi:hypothetical protein
MQGKAILFNAKRIWCCTANKNDDQKAGSKIRHKESILASSPSPKVAG